MSGMASAALRGGGESLVRESTPRGPPSANSTRSQDMSMSMTVDEMETRLLPRPSKGGRGSLPMSARELLEENKQLIEEKKEQKALARKNSREMVQKLIEEDRMKSEGLKATVQSRRSMLKDLAQQYKASIAEKEQQRAALKASKRGPPVSYFPFVEGETIAKGRAAKSQVLREEMQGFLQKQREQKPPRNDQLIQDTRVDNILLYPVQPKATPQSTMQSQTMEEPLFLVEAPLTPEVQHGDAIPEAEMKLVDETCPHMQRHPVFLTKARDHKSRRLYDDHVRRTLEEKVEQTKIELAQLARKRQEEVQTLEDSMLVADALRHDGTTAKADARRRHAMFLKEQMQEQQTRREEEKANKKKETAGYWGPEDKPTQASQSHRNHCHDLIKQMEVDQNRRLVDRTMHLRQEKQIVNNCLAQMEQDREMEKQKIKQHREVLVTTWKSQLQLREVMKNIEGI
ncbi:unnamed protein product [Durusdinium trenchii]|uniref:Uncharacterized protein n=1 Tax=Durusdinium trenchii TaxID=1381693 RepID=A0ABP0SNX6_9DINO